MWDPEQLAEIPVIADRLQALGDPLGEWLAVRMRLDMGGLARPERQQLRRRTRALRGRLGSRLVLADEPGFGRLHVIRELGLIADVHFEQATPGRLTQLFSRPDAPFVLRLHLRGGVAALSDCVELLLALDERASDSSRTRTSLRQLQLDLDTDTDGNGNAIEAGHALVAELTRRGAELGARLPSLFTLDVNSVAIPLPFVSAALDRHEQVWTPARRAELGRALASPEPSDRRRALERMGEHGEHAGQLGAPLLTIIDRDPEPSVRAAAFAIVPGLGRVAHSIIALTADSARERDDPPLHEWLQKVRKT